MGSPPTQLGTLTEERESVRVGEPLEAEPPQVDGAAEVRELRMFVRALRSFFDPGNHPLAVGNQSDLVAHDWSNELRVARVTLLRCSRLLHRLINLENLEKSDQTIFDDVEEAVAFDDLPAADVSDKAESELKDDSLGALAALIGEASELCESVGEARPLRLHAWTNLGEAMGIILDSFEQSSALSAAESTQTALNIPAPLLAIAREKVKPPSLGADILHIFSGIFELLDYLGHVEKLLRADQSLKQSLPIFTLVNERARGLVNFMKNRPLREEGLEQDVFDALDSTNYAISMELRKVFAYELLGISSLRQAPAIYIKVETAHGLLSNSFRQSVIALAQMFDASIDGHRLFDAFQTRLEQSLVLRRDLWTLSQLVTRAEKEPEPGLVQRLRDRLVAFYEGSLRFLMFKDWESCERFMEEVGAARGPEELAPVLHRFSAYLEALSSQVSMRAVLAEHPFDYPKLEDE